MPSGDRVLSNGLIFPLLLIFLPFDALNEGDPLKLSGSYLVRKN